MKKNMISQPKPILCPNCRTEEKVSIKIKGKFNIYYCSGCHNGFTSPVPKHIEQYYPGYYWKTASVLENIKNTMFRLLQRRRVDWVRKVLPKSKGYVLDVGSGEGRYFSSLREKYKLVNLEPPASKVKNKTVIKTDFLKWKTKDRFDVICFMESLEHTPSPQRYLTKANKILKDKGWIIIEFPRYNCLESKLMGKNWFHLDLPRHLAHLTDKGVVNLLTRTDFTNIKIKEILSLDYAPWGLAASILNGVNIDITDYFKKSGNLILFILITPMVIICGIFEIFFLLINQSPLAVVIAKKR